MSYEEREKMFSKEYLSIKDFELLFGLPYSNAAKFMRQIKFKHDRLHMQGKLHVEDYFEYFNITDRVRYIRELDTRCEECANY